MPFEGGECNIPKGSAQKRKKQNKPTEATGEGRQTKPPKSTKQSQDIRDAGNIVSVPTPHPRTLLVADSTTNRLPGIIEIGPMTTVGEVLAAKRGGPPARYDDRMVQPTVAELHTHLMSLFNKEKEGGGSDGIKKPVFGPERPQQQEKGGL